MKKLLFLGSALLFLFAITSCKKEVSAPYSGNQTANFKENGYTWAGWDIKNPITKFDTVDQNIYIGDRSWNNAANQLQGKELESSGPKTVYAVKSFTQGNFYNIKNDLERRGWKIAPLAYLLGLTKEYGFEENQIWNIYCLNIPVKAVFNGGNPEEFTVQVYGGPIYISDNNKTYRMGINFTPYSNQYGGIKVLCYR